MSLSGAQEFWTVGGRFYFQRADDGATKFPMIDLGLLKAAPKPTIAPTTAQLYDSDGGVLRLADEVATKIDETYELNGANFAPANLELLFLADPAEAFTQASTQQTDVVHYAHPGHLVKIRDANGVEVYDLTSVDGLKDGSDQAINASKWSVVDLKRGIIKLASDAIVAAGNIKITFTPKAITGLRLIKPQTAQIIRGTGLMFWGRDNNASQSVRKATVSILPSGVNLSAEQHSDWTMKVSVLSDITSTTPAGSLIHFVGTLPATA